MRVKHLLMSGAVAAALVAGVGGSAVTSFAATTGHTSSVSHKHDKPSPSGEKHNTPKSCTWVNKHHHDCKKVAG